MLASKSNQLRVKLVDVSQKKISLVVIIATQVNWKVGVRGQNRHEDFLKKKMKDSKRATCPLAPLPTRRRKLEKFKVFRRSHLGERMTTSTKKTPEPKFQGGV